MARPDDLTYFEQIAEGFPPPPPPREAPPSASPSTPPSVPEMARPDDLPAVKNDLADVDDRIKIAGAAPEPPPTLQETTTPPEEVIVDPAGLAPGYEGSSATPTLQVTTTPPAIGTLLTPVDEAGSPQFAKGRFGFVTVQGESGPVEMTYGQYQNLNTGGSLASFQRMQDIGLLDRDTQFVPAPNGSAPNMWSFVPGASVRVQREAEAALAPYTSTQDGQTLIDVGAAAAAGQNLALRNAGFSWNEINAARTQYNAIDSLKPYTKVENGDTYVDVAGAAAAGLSDALQLAGFTSGQIAAAMPTSAPALDEFNSGATNPTIFNVPSFTAASRTTVPLSQALESQFSQSGIARWWRNITPWQENQGQTFGSWLQAPSRTVHTSVFGPGTNLETYSRLATVATLPALAMPVTAASTPLAEVVGTRALSLLGNTAMTLGRLGAATTVGTGVGLTLAGRNLETPTPGVLAAVPSKDVAEALLFRGGYASNPDEEGRYTINVAKLQEDYGQAGASAILAGIGNKPTIERGLWDQLPANLKDLYTPTARTNLAYSSNPIVAAYGRGSNLFAQELQGLSKLGPQWHLGSVPVGPGALASGMLSYFAPHNLVSELYSNKGAAAFATLVPHFGPTAIAPFVADASTGQKALGVGMSLLPYAAGPISSGTRAFGRVLSSVPRVGPAFAAFGRGASWVLQTPRELTTGVSNLFRDFTGRSLPSAQGLMPWNAAYTLSRGAGRVGLARVPGLSQAGQTWGWWSTKAAPKALRLQRRQLTNEEVQTIVDRDLAAAEREGNYLVRRPEADYTFNAQTQEWTPLKPGTFEEIQRLNPSMTGSGAVWTEPRGPYTWSGRASVPVAAPAPVGNRSLLMNIGRATTAATALISPFSPVLPALYANPVVAGTFVLPIATTSNTIADLNAVSTAVINAATQEGVITPVQQSELTAAFSNAAKTSTTRAAYDTRVTQALQTVLASDQLLAMQLQDVINQQTQQDVLREQVVETPTILSNMINPLKLPYTSTLSNTIIPNETATVTGSIPPIPPLDIFGYPGRVSSGGASGRTRLPKGLVGLWNIEGYNVFGPDPLTGKIVGGKVGKKSVRYGTATTKAIRGAL